MNSEPLLIWLYDAAPHECRNVCMYVCIRDTQQGLGFRGLGASGFKWLWVSEFRGLAKFGVYASGFVGFRGPSFKEGKVLRSP